MINVVVINGGRGAASIIPAFLNCNGFNLTSIVNAYDDGKSTGEIRRFFGMLGPSDIRKVQSLMLDRSSVDFLASESLFEYRFPVKVDRDEAINSIVNICDGEEDKLIGCKFENRNIINQVSVYLRRFLNCLDLIERYKGELFNYGDCSVMNCIYAGAFLVHDRNISVAANRIEKLFRLNGSVEPTNIENKVLVGMRENGEVLFNEAEIVELRSNVRIDRVYILDQYPDEKAFESFDNEEKRRYLQEHESYVSATESSCRAISSADIIIYASGTQHSSLYPSYLSIGLAESIADNKAALKVFVTNIGADYETPGYVASDYIKGAFRYMNMADGRTYRWGDLFTHNFVNRASDIDCHNYVEVDEALSSIGGVDLVVDDFESEDSVGKHDGDKVRTAIMRIYNEFMGCSNEVS